MSVSGLKVSGSLNQSILAFPDEYRRRARLKPAMLEVLPGLLVLAVCAFGALGGAQCGLEVRGDRNSYDRRRAGLDRPLRAAGA